MERRVIFPFGINDVYPNMYVFLVGPPAVRKSTALKVLRDILELSTSVKFAPDDTSGRKQGILTAFLQDEDITEELTDAIGTALLDESGASLASLERKAEGKSLEQVIGSIPISTTSDRVMLALASELGTFLGVNSPELMPFLTKLWDGESYRYQLKTETKNLKNALLSILGGTTPAGIARSMPPEAMDQGFLSRVILVYAGQKYKSIARPQRLPENLLNDLRKHYYEVSQLYGAMSETKEAGLLIDEAYEAEVKVQDPRLIYYKERRHTHMIKTAMCFAASRGSLVLEPEDVIHATGLLTATEENMTEALGEFGMTKTSIAKQQLIEFIKHTIDPVPASVIKSFMRNNVTQIELRNIMHELEAAKQIKHIVIHDVDHFVWKEGKRSTKDSEIFKLLG